MMRLTAAVIGFVWMTLSLSLMANDAFADCPFLTKPYIEMEEGVTRTNSWGSGQQLCHQGYMMTCVSDKWRQGEKCGQDAWSLSHQAWKMEGSFDPAGGSGAGSTGSSAAGGGATGSGIVFGRYCGTWGDGSPASLQIAQQSFSDGMGSGQYTSGAGKEITYSYVDDFLVKDGVTVVTSISSTEIQIKQSGYTPSGQFWSGEPQRFQKCD